MEINKMLIHHFNFGQGGNGFYKKVEGHQINFETGEQKFLQRSQPTKIILNIGSGKKMAAP